MSNNELENALGMYQGLRMYLENVTGKRVWNVDQEMVKIREQARIQGIKNRRPWILKLRDVEETLLGAMIGGGIKMAINAHGPVTLFNFTSAVKRILGFLLAEIGKMDRERERVG